jgi:nickel-dependent lactate racemase
MQKFDAPFDIVVTTNSGYPLDQNLYQAVKGMSAGARVTKLGGTLIIACECREGVPPGSSFDELLRIASSPAEILSLLASPGFQRPEQWQAQIQAIIQRNANVLLYSSLADEVVRRAHLPPCHDIAGAVNGLVRQNGSGARIAVLPQGPLTIPYLG